MVDFNEMLMGKSVSLSLLDRVSNVCTLYKISPKSSGCMVQVQNARCYLQNTEIVFNLGVT